jgi:hypothetical protein
VGSHGSSHLGPETRSFPGRWGVACTSGIWEYDVGVAKTSTHARSTVRDAPSAKSQHLTVRDTPSAKETRRAKKPGAGVGGASRQRERKEVIVEIVVADFSKDRRREKD